MEAVPLAMTLLAFHPPHPSPQRKSDFTQLINLKRINWVHSLTSLLTETPLGGPAQCTVPGPRTGLKGFPVLWFIFGNLTDSNASWHLMQLIAFIGNKSDIWVPYYLPYFSTGSENKEWMIFIKPQKNHINPKRGIHSAWVSKLLD